jgi:prepilin-type N-terminal cleavage/methylation domain-containing protein
VILLLPHLNANDDRGFSLVEVIISIALLALISLFAVQAVKQLVSYRRAEMNYQHRMLAERFLQNLRAELQSVRSPDNMADSILTGGVGEIEYALVSKGRPEAAGIYRVRYWMEDGNIWHSQKLIDKSAEKKSYIILPDVSNVRFSYSDTSSAQPRQNWNEEDSLPAAVDVAIKLNNSDIPLSLTIIMPLALH